jgi:hypothetical protein
MWLKVVPPATEIKTNLAQQPELAPPVPTGGKYDWMAAAGISPSDYPAVDYIVTHESGWNPLADGPMTGLGQAHGLPQALPYAKTGCGWEDPICQLKWADGYAHDRYGGWWSAYQYWIAHGNW